MPTSAAPPKHLTQAAIKSLNDQSVYEVPKKLDLTLQVLKVDEIMFNPERKETAKIKQK